MSDTILWSVVETGPAMADWLSGEGLEFLSSAEKQSLAGLRFERRRAEWLLGRWTAKRLIQASGAVDRDKPLAAIEIIHEPEGAPYAVSSPSNRIPGCLTISHRSGVAACAWVSGEQTRIGMDIDLVEARDPSFLGDYFTDREQAFAHALPGDLQDVWVTLAWSAKESVMKALRTGLRIDTRRVQVGGVRGLFQSEDMDRGWKTITVHYDAAPQANWQAFWQKRGEFVITLVGLGSEKPWILHEL